MTKFQDVLDAAIKETETEFEIKPRGKPRLIPYELALELYEFNGGIRKTVRALASMGYTNPRTEKPYSYHGVRDAILYAQELRDRQRSSEGETEPG